LTEHIDGNRLEGSSERIRIIGEVKIPTIYGGVPGHGKFVCYEKNPFFNAENPVSDISSRATVRGGNAPGFAGVSSSYC
jgi:hypothetical protein